MLRFAVPVLCMCKVISYNIEHSILLAVPVLCVCEVISYNIQHSILLAVPVLYFVCINLKVVM